MKIKSSLFILTLLFTAQSLLAQSFRNRVLATDENSGFYMKDSWVGEGSVIKGEDGQYHMFASRWPKELTFLPHRFTNAEIVHAVSVKPEGPYTFSDIVLPPRGEPFWDGKMTTNPAIRKYGDTYLLFYTGSTYTGEIPNEKHPLRSESQTQMEAMEHQKIGFATSKSLYGPWTRTDSSILDMTSNFNDSSFISNPSPIIFEDGRIMLYYTRTEQLNKKEIKVAEADHWWNSYKTISDKPIEIGFGNNAATVWFENGVFKALLSDDEKKYSEKDIYYAQSIDGIKWTLESNPIALTKNILLKNGKTLEVSAIEQPKVFIENGTATHVFFAAKNKTNTIFCNICIPLKKNEQITDNTQWYREARFGMMIHWGLYTLPGGVWKGKPNKEKKRVMPLLAEHIMLQKEIPISEYAQMVNRFNPTSFDADKIVRMAKNCGMRYIVFTTKHNDGFAMYNSKVSLYNVVNATPYGKDPLKMLSEACKKYNIKLCLYYSLGRDWEDPNAISNEEWRNFWDFPNASTLSYEKYLDEKVKPQLTELLTNYGDIGMIWFDAPELTTQKQSISLELLVKQLQPGCIINTQVGNHVGDVEEISLNTTAEKEKSKAMEYSETMAQSWGYSTLDTKEFWKSSNELIEKMIETNSNGGNYLLNFGLDGKGLIPSLAAERLKDISKWMTVNGESIYNTTSVTDKIYNGYLTQNKTHFFLFIKKGNEQHVSLFIDPARVNTISILTQEGGKSLKYNSISGKELQIDLPNNMPYEWSVIKIEKK